VSAHLFGHLINGKSCFSIGRDSVSFFRGELIVFHIFFILSFVGEQNSRDHGSPHFCYEKFVALKY